MPALASAEPTNEIFKGLSCSQAVEGEATKLRFKGPHPAADLITQEEAREIMRQLLDRATDSPCYQSKPKPADHSKQ